MALVSAKPALIAQETRNPDGGYHEQSYPRNEEDLWHLLYQVSILPATLSLASKLLSKFKLLGKITWSETELLLRLPDGVPPMPHVRVGLFVALVPHYG